ncbi:conserved hypothetical protein [Streptomyces viridochromogenes DSM 40736]|uniref:Uncharacterized protein n=1 Tax=Streptomyces viridochromogenes (strain DSM 40736 / JCM 4977 / BCRC 1201 / Tue 494) TaxID=591159 RepID=D9X1U2_STRVT|nr:conserved hypothetical protein [Streptomyces viridochromogenes DSM 40736]
MPPATIRRWTGPTPQKAEPPLDVDALLDVIAKFRRWTPFDGEALLDDVCAVPDDVVPSADEFEGHAERLGGHLMRLVDIALAAEAHQMDDEATRLIRQAREVRAQRSCHASSGPP